VKANCALPSGAAGNRIALYFPDDDRPDLDFMIIIHDGGAERLQVPVYLIR